MTLVRKSTTSSPGPFPRRFSKWLIVGRRPWQTLSHVVQNLITFMRRKVNFELNFSRHFLGSFSKCHVIKISKIFWRFCTTWPSLCQGLLPTIRHFENRRGEGPGDEVAGVHYSLGKVGWFLCEKVISYFQLCVNLLLGDSFNIIFLKLILVFSKKQKQAVLEDCILNSPSLAERALKHTFYEYSQLKFLSSSINA